MVAPKNTANSKKDERFQKNKFEYKEKKDIYICPEGHELTTNGRYYEQKRKGTTKPYRFTRYTIKYSTCSNCPYAEACVGGKLKQSQGKSIERSEFADAMEHNNEQVAARRNEYKRRQAIVEHPFGTIKRNWGYTYTLLKSKEKVETEFSIIFLCYNLKRVMSILGLEGLKKALKGLLLRFLMVWAVMVRRVSPGKFNVVTTCGVW